MSRVVRKILENLSTVPSQGLTRPLHYATIWPMKRAKRLRGRRRKLAPTAEKKMVSDYLKNRGTVAEIAERYGVSRPTVYAALGRAS